MDRLQVHAGIVAVHEVYWREVSQLVLSWTFKNEIYFIIVIRIAEFHSYFEVVIKDCIYYRSKRIWVHVYPSGWYQLLQRTQKDRTR